jgi:hypothetical protein
MPWLCVDENGYGYCKICPDGYWNHPSGCCAPICKNDYLCETYRFDGFCEKCIIGAYMFNNCCYLFDIDPNVDPKN